LRCIMLNQKREGYCPPPSFIF